MPEVSTLVVRLTSPELEEGLGGASTPGGSLGGYVATTLLDLETLEENLFPDVTGEQRRDGRTDYRAVGLHNTHATESVQGAVAWVSEQAAVATITVGVDPAGAVAEDSSSSQGATSDGTSAPSGVTFSGPTSAETGVALPTILAGQVLLLWLRRTVAPQATGDAAQDDWAVSVGRPA